MRRMHLEQRLSRSVIYRMLYSSNDSRTHFRIFMAAFSVVVLALIGCADFGSGTPQDDGGCQSNNATVSFATQILPIFQANCGTSSCHFPCGPFNRLGICLASHEAIIAAGIVIPGDPENSIIIRALEGRDVTPMPYGRVPLNDSLILRIRTWINECALNN